MRSFYVYLHCRPDGTPFYVGKGTGRRSHGFGGRAGRNQHHKNIVAKYGRRNIDILVFKVESAEAAKREEQATIALIRGQGIALSNRTDGGDGGYGCACSPEKREKLRIAMSGRTMPIETRRKISEALKGRVFTTVHRERHAAALRGLPKSAEHRASLSAAFKGKPISDEHRANIIAGVRTDEARAKLVAAATRNAVLRERDEKGMFK